MSTDVKNKGGGKSKDREYDMYCLWRSLPPLWRKMSHSELTDKMGIDDDDTLDMLSIRTQGDFAKRYKVAPKTLSAWNERMEQDGNTYLDRTRGWATKLNKNVVMALYNKILRKPDPVSVELWAKMIDGYNEKKNIKIEGKLSLMELADELLEDE